MYGRLICAASMGSPPVVFVEAFQVLLEFHANLEIRGRWVGRVTEDVSEQRGYT